MQIKRKHESGRNGGDMRVTELESLELGGSWRATGGLGQGLIVEGEQTAAVGRRQQVGGVKSCGEGQQMRMTAELEVAVRKWQQCSKQLR